MTLRLAHRGDHRRLPENSLAALVAGAAASGSDGVEFDVRFGRDGRPVVIHDETLERTHGRPVRVAECTADELERLGVPALETVLAALPVAAFLDIELKEPPKAEFARVLLAARGAAPVAAAISSFDAAALTALDPGLATWPRWLNALDLAPATLATAVAARCSVVAVLWSGIDDAGLRRAAAAGLGVAAWTVRRRPTRARLARLGVAAICVEGPALEP